MTAWPLVSIVVPTRNSGRFLAETLEAVAAQTLADHEIIVVDAGSTDDSLQIAGRHAKARVISQQSTGLSGAWNEGIAAGRGELIAFLDSDDLWHPRKLELQAAYLHEHPDVELVATRMRFFLSPGEAMPSAFDRPGLLDNDHTSLFPGNILVRKRLFGVVGVFDPSLAIAGDMDWFARIRDRQIATHVLPETLYFKRLHGGNLSHGSVARQVWTKELAATVRASIRRKRQGDAGVPSGGREVGADRFLSWLDSCIAGTAADVPDVVRTAEVAAARYVRDGESVGIFGDQGLVSEAIGRSGGIIGMRRASPPGRTVTPNWQGIVRLLRLASGRGRLVAADWRGIVLCFPRESGLADDFAEIRSFLRSGRHVVMFGRESIRAAAEAAGVRPHAFVRSHAAEHGGLFQDAHGRWTVPTEHAADIVALWAWLGEFIAACTRLGQMPVIYQSYDVPGARQRPERFRGMKFHAEPPVPMEAGRAAREYLANLRACLGRFRCGERQHIRQAAEAALESKRLGRRLYAFPHNHTLLRGRLGGLHDPGYFTQLNESWFNAKPMLPVERGDLVFCVGHSRIYAGGDFGTFADDMRSRGARLIWSLASYDRDPVCGTAGIRTDEIFIDQHWGYGDAVVEVPGHDVRILPTSGVMAEAVMWSVVSDMQAELGG